MLSHLLPALEASQLREGGVVGSAALVMLNFSMMPIVPSPTGPRETEATLLVLAKSDDFDGDHHQQTLGLALLATNGIKLLAATGARLSGSTPFLSDCSTV